MALRVTVQWTTTARNLLAALPLKVRNGLVTKIGDLRTSDPRQAGKPLIGPFLGYRRLTYSRYRAIFSVEEEPLANGEVRLHVVVRVVAVGMRKEHDKNDVYKVAKKLIDLGILPGQEAPEDPGAAE